MSRWSAVALGLIVLTGVWHLTTLRPGHEWGDDFALYLGHARNLIEGTPYAETGYIYNPAYSSLSPRTYPPVLPLLAAPVYYFFGLEILPYKVLIIGLFLLFLLVMFITARRELPAACVAGLILLLGAHPFFWEYKDRILSEIPFLLFTAAALGLLVRLHEGELSTAGRIALGCLAGVAVYLACGTRTVGIVLIPCVLLQDCLREAKGAALLNRGHWRLPSSLSGSVLGVFLLGVVIQKTLLVVEGSYLDQLVFDPQLFLRNFLSLFKAMSSFFDNTWSETGRRLLYTVTSILALIGYVRCVRQGPTAREFFVPTYFAVITIWPCSEWSARFLLPLLPLYLIYLLHGLVVVADKVPALVLKPAVGVLLAALLVSYVGQYSRMSFGPLPGIARSESRQLFDYVRARTSPDSVLLFQRPRALALFTGRRASAHQTPITDQELWQYLEKIGASHVVIGKPWEESRSALEGFVERNGDHLVPVFRNAQFTIYQVQQPRAGVDRMTAAAEQSPRNR